MLTGLSRRVRELGRGDRDRYACCYVGDESKGRGRLNWTLGRSPSARALHKTLSSQSYVGKRHETSALLGQACARAAQATQPLSPAAPLLSVDRCALAGTAFDVAASMLESSSALRAPRPDLLYRSGRGAFQRLRACLAEGGRAFRCDGVCGRYAAHSRARSELDTMFSIPNHVMLHEPS